LIIFWIEKNVRRSSTGRPGGQDENPDDAGQRSYIYLLLAEEPGIAREIKLFYFILAYGIGTPGTHGYSKQMSANMAQSFGQL